MNIKTKHKKSNYNPTSPAVSQAAKNLMCIGDSSESQMSLTHICKEVDIHKSKGYSILNSLIEFDFIKRDAATKSYS